MNATEFWDYCHRPENEHHELDLSRGRVIEWPRRNRKQGVVAAQLAMVLGNYAHVVGGGYPTLACGVVLGPNREIVRGIDAGYFTDADDGDWWATIPPRLAVHIVGPDDDRSEWVARVQDFLDHGTKLVWLADYEERTVTVYRPGQAFVILKAADAIADVPELPGFACTVADFFRLPGRAAA